MRRQNLRNQQLIKIKTKVRPENFESLAFLFPYPYHEAAHRKIIRSL